MVSQKLLRSTATSGVIVSFASSVSYWPAMNRPRAPTMGVSASAMRCLLIHSVIRSASTATPVMNTTVS